MSWVFVVSYPVPGLAVQPRPTSLGVRRLRPGWCTGKGSGVEAGIPSRACSSSVSSFLLPRSQVLLHISLYIYICLSWCRALCCARRRNCLRPASWHGIVMFLYPPVCILKCMRVSILGVHPPSWCRRRWPLVVALAYLGMSGVEAWWHRVGVLRTRRVASYWGTGVDEHGHTIPLRFHVPPPRGPRAAHPPASAIRAPPCACLLFGGGNRCPLCAGNQFVLQPKVSPRVVDVRWSSGAPLQRMLGRVGRR